MLTSLNLQLKIDDKHVRQSASSEPLHMRGAFVCHYSNIISTAEGILLQGDMKLFWIVLYLASEQISDTLSVHVYHLLRLKKYQPLNESNQYIDPIIFTINQHKYEQYIAGYFKVIGEPKFEKLTISVQQCNLDALQCRDYATYKIPKLEPFYYAKDAPWSNFVKSIHPRLQFPILRKGWYTLNNATLSVDGFVSAKPDMINYYWKTTSRVFDKQNKLQAGVYIDMMVLQFMERDRKVKVQAISPINA